MTPIALQSELSPPIQFEVLVVGGGPAGSTLARALTQCGMRVGVLDKEQFPRQKVCAGWVTPAVMQELEIDLDDYGRNFVPAYPLVQNRPDRTKPGAV
jgi:flavin-dependent dehydrogenase